MKTVAYIMAKDEAENIVRCIDSLNWCDKVIVADTGSKDNTIQLARTAGAEIIEIPFEGFGKTRNNIINRIDADWIVCFDADEVCTPALASEIVRSIKIDKFEAFKAPRQNYLLGKKIRHSGWYPDFRHPICFKKNSCAYDEKEVHEGLEVKGKIGFLKEPFDHYSHKNLFHYVEKSTKYAQLGAHELIKKNKSVKMTSAIFHGSFRFIRHYVLKLGFLDGWAGLTIALTSAYGTFIRYASAYEMLSKLDLKHDKEN